MNNAMPEMTNTVPLAGIDDERARRLAALRADGVGACEHFERCLDEYAAKKELEAIRGALEFALNLDYAHEGLSKEAYVAHPLRVAELTLQSRTTGETETTILALLHNVFEVTSIAHRELAERFGASIADGAQDLCVDRGRTDAAYKEEYYGRLAAGWRASRVVKICDKLDSMFLLCLNPDDAIRRDYLAEIDTWVLPMAQRELPAVAPYMARLAADCRRTGYSKAAVESLS